MKMLGKLPKCNRCGRYYTVGPQSYDLYTDNIDARLLMRNYCPQCISAVTEYLRIQAKQGQQDILNKKVYEKEQISLSWLFKILVVISLITLGYSLISKFLPQFKLPNFPFIYYTIGYALFVFLAFFMILNFIKSIGNGRINTPVFFNRFITRFLKSRLGLILVLCNFAFPTFRNVFFSHFDRGIWTIILTILFVLSNIISLSVIFSFLYQRMVSSFMKKMPMRQSVAQISIAALANLLTLLILVISLYFGLISPYYLGVIKPGPFKVENLDPEPHPSGSVYIEPITEKNVDEQTARQYLREGKRKAALGNIEGFLGSIKLYRMALQLIPDFSTALVEMAYSYGSIGRILEDSGTDLGNIRENFVKAEEALSRAKKLNSENPGVYAVEAILEYYKGNKENTQQTFENLGAYVVEAFIKYYKGNEEDIQQILVKVMDLAGNKGDTDKVLLAMAFLEKKKVKKVEYLLEIREMDPDNAELLNFLGIAYYQIGNTEKARMAIERAIRLNPEYSEANLNLALVSTDKENIYKKVMEESNNFKQIAKVYLKYWNAQNGLRMFYLAMLVYFIIINFILIMKSIDPNKNTFHPEYLKRRKTIFRWCFSLFIFTYLVFEWDLHYGHQLNSLSHLFPTIFPFF